MLRFSHYRKFHKLSPASSFPSLVWPPLNTLTDEKMFVLLKTGARLEVEKGSDI